MINNNPDDNFQIMAIEKEAALLTCEPFAWRVPWKQRIGHLLVQPHLW
jgi:hypothetical protein